MEGNRNNALLDNHTYLLKLLRKRLTMCNFLLSAKLRSERSFLGSSDQPLMYPGFWISVGREAKKKGEDKVYLQVHRSDLLSLERRSGNADYPNGGLDSGGLSGLILTIKIISPGLTFQDSRQVLSNDSVGRFEPRTALF